MSDEMWKYLIDKTPEIIGAVFVGLALLWERYRTATRLRENTELTQAGIDATARMDTRMDTLMGQTRRIAAEQVRLSQAELLKLEGLAGLTPDPAPASSPPPSR